ncbi:hypothetical protein BWI17_19245 [Betaproteobacteria bacterium GR16-43]|nr:hypothetical protein BWI17_19245 [Betaproteobacteria bacterium GR16-43]
MFLTKLDNRAAVKGSRDPLGVQPIWTRLGRHVVGNLTTVSGTVTEYTTVLLGYHLADEVERATGGSRLDTFLKWEQLVAYARGVVNNDWVFRGTERAQERFNDKGHGRIGADRDSQIMSDQKAYGLWGLYSAPSTASGFLDGSPPRLTPLAAAHVESQYLPVLNAGGQANKRLMQLLSRESSKIDLRREDDELLQSVARVHKRKLSKADIRFFDHHLLEGGPSDRTGGLQRIFADLLEPLAGTGTFSWSTSTLRKIAAAASTRGSDGKRLSEKLLRIADCESVMAPAFAAFSYLQTQDEAPIDSILRAMKAQWGKGLKSIDVDQFADLRNELDSDPDTGDRWIQIARATRDGAYQDLIELLVRHNSAVMGIRGGAPWLELRHGRLKVKYRDETAALPDAKEAERLWRHPYFLEPLRVVVGILRPH